MTKKVIHQLYVKDMERENQNHVKYDRFIDLMNTLFPYVVQRTYCDIPGKCMTCFHIDKLRNETSDKQVQVYLSQAHALHRSCLFMPERVLYKMRVSRAVSCPKKRMSIIIDIMDQNHCKCPYMGTQQSFDNTMQQIIVGVKMHGVGLFIYRSWNTVTKGANLIIFVISHLLELWQEAAGGYLDELYLQIDGGSENANKFVLAFCELLVAHR
jgi:hypothetical protein